MRGPSTVNRSRRPDALYQSTTNQQRENELLRADVGDASIGTADQTHDPSAASAAVEAEAARTAANELQRHV